MFGENKKIEKMNDNIIIDLVDNYDFSDITYDNDLCRSVGYELDTYSDGNGGGNWGMYFQIFLINSENNNYDEEEFNTYNLLLCDEQSDNLIETYNSSDFNFDTIEEVLSFVLSNKDINKNHIIYEEDYRKEMIQNLYQIQEFMSCDIFDASPFEDEEKNEILNNDLYNSLTNAIKIIENK